MRVTLSPHAHADQTSSSTASAIIHLPLRFKSILFSGSRRTLMLIIVWLLAAVVVLFVTDTYLATRCFSRSGMQNVFMYMSDVGVRDLQARNLEQLQKQRRLQAGQYEIEKEFIQDTGQNNRNVMGEKRKDILNEVNQVRADNFDNNENDVPLPKAHKDDTLVYDEASDDLFANISFSDLKHMVENNGLNKTAFTLWSKDRLLHDRQPSFTLPRWLISGKKVCQADTELIIVMPSVPDHQFTRELIRQTWAGSIYGIPWPRRKIYLNTKLVFLMGSASLEGYKKGALQREWELYQDVVLADFVDSYRNLTLKMMVGLQWVAQFCPQARYILKCDLDTFVNLPLMTKILPVISSKVSRFVMGHKHELALPPVLREGKWEITRDDYPFEFFPPYVIGHSYVISAELAPRLVSVARYMPLIPAEDAHITGVLARILRVPRLHFEGFAHLKKDCLPCNMVFNEEVSMTKMSLSRLLIMWRNVQTNICSADELPLRGNVFIQGQGDSSEYKKIDEDEDKKDEKSDDGGHPGQKDEGNKENENVVGKDDKKLGVGEEENGEAKEEQKL